MKTTFIPHPKVDYRALYPWASEDVLVETSALTSNKDVMKHREDEAAHMLRVFGRECDAYVSSNPAPWVSPCALMHVQTAGSPYSFFTPPSSNKSSFVYRSRGSSGLY